MTAPTLRFTSGSDVVTVTASLLGYKPREAVALLMLTREGSVSCGMALPLDALHPGGLIPSIHASGHLRHLSPHGHLIVIIFTTHHDIAQTLLDELHATTDGLVGSIANIFITNWRTVWEGWDGTPQMPQPYDPTASMAALRASGQNDPAESRDELVGYIREPGQPVNLERHQATVAYLSETEIETRLLEILDGPPIEADPDRATLAAVLFAHIVEGSRKILDTVITGNRHWRHQLAAMYAHTPNDPEQRATMLLLYGVACWATRATIHATECADYLKELKGHPTILDHILNHEPPTA